MNASGTVRVIVRLRLPGPRFGFVYARCPLGRTDLPFAPKRGNSPRECTEVVKRGRL